MFKSYNGWAAPVILNWGEYKCHEPSVTYQPSILKADRSIVSFVKVFCQGLPVKVSILDFKNEKFSLAVDDVIAEHYYYRLRGQALIDLKSPSQYLFTGFNTVLHGKEYLVRSTTDERTFSTRLKDSMRLSIAKNNSHIFVKSEDSGVLVKRDDYKKVLNSPRVKKGGYLGCGDFFYQHRIYEQPNDIGESTRTKATEITKYDSNMTEVASSIFPYALQIKCNAKEAIYTVKYLPETNETSSSYAKRGIYSLEENQSELELRLIGNTSGERYPNFNISTSPSYGREKTQPINDKYLIHAPRSGVDKNTGRIYKIQFFEYSDNMRIPSFSCIFNESYTLASIAEISNETFVIHAVNAESKNLLIKINPNHSKKCEIYTED